MIRRDLRRLRQRCAPYDYGLDTDPRYPGQDSVSPAVNLNRTEAMLLLPLAYRAADCWDSPLKELTLRAASKLEGILSGETREFCMEYLRNAAVRVGPHTQADSKDGIFWQLADAIRGRRIVEIRYCPDAAQHTVITDLSPYRLVHDEHAWHVIGRSDLHCGTRTFKLNRIKELRVLHKCFAGPENFDMTEYLGKAWSIAPEGTLYDVKLRFLPEVAPDVVQVQWHGTQRVSFGVDGSSTVEFCVDGLSEITWWILSYGDKVQVLAPDALRERIIGIARNMVRTASAELPR